MRNKLFCLLLAALLLFTAASAELHWPEAKTDAQRQLQTFVNRVNANLTSLNVIPVNSLFEYYTFSVTLGITEFENAVIPEGIELSFTLLDTTLDRLVLRCNDPSRFAVIAGACIQAATGDSMTLQAAMTEPDKYARQAMKYPENSFKQNIVSARGEKVRTYFAYYPNQYHDEKNWIEMTMIFSFNGFSDGVLTTAMPGNRETNAEYEGYLPVLDGSHYDTFATPTPEPDSPAGGFWE